jgi:hypothetical protein
VTPGGIQAGITLGHLDLHPVGPYRALHARAGDPETEDRARVVRLVHGGGADLLIAELGQHLPGRLQ